MSLLGIDIGTSGCKAVVFSIHGKQLARSYRDYKITTPQEGYAELDSHEVWNKIKETIREVAVQTQADPIQALSVSSLGEAMVPVTRRGEILANSILGIDKRGSEFIELIQSKYDPHEIFRITGNFPGLSYSISKIAWIKKYQPELYEKTDYFLLWADFVCFMLGGMPVTNFSLAGRTLMFDIRRKVWSEEIMSVVNLEKQKFAPPMVSGVFLGTVSTDLSTQLQLNENVAIVSGGHDQCCATLGSGTQSSSSKAMLGMGTFICVVPVYFSMPDIESAFARKLHIEYHVIPGSFITFIYNQSGGAMVEWIEETFFPSENFSDQKETYKMFEDIPSRMTDILVFPGFGAMGPPDFCIGSLGSIHNLSFEHTRGDIIKAMLESLGFYIKSVSEQFDGTFRNIKYLVATGGCSASGKWLQIIADILGITILRNKVIEAGSLGAAIIAGKGYNLFSSFDEAVDLMVHKDLTVTPDLSKKGFYEAKFERYKKMKYKLRIKG
jgi:xylulokinase